MTREWIRICRHQEGSGRVLLVIGSSTKAWLDQGGAKGPLLQNTAVKSESSASSVVSDSATPWTVARQAPLSVGFSRQEHWSGVPCPSPGDLPDSGSTQLSHIAGRLLII